MKATYFGHSCLMVECGGFKLLFDPFITPNPKAAAIDTNALRPDFVLLTHGHADHVADAEAILKASGATLISNFEVVTWFGARGVENSVPMNTGGGRDLPFGRVTCTAAVHSSSMPDGSYGGNPMGFVIDSPEGAFHISGDTALTHDMRLIGEKWNLRWAGLCIGDHFTMGPQDAARAAKWIGTPRVIGMHYDTFPPIEINHDTARRDFLEAGIELLLPAIGDTVDLG